MCSAFSATKEQKAVEETGGKGKLTSASLNESVRSKNELFLAAYSGPVTRLGEIRGGKEGGRGADPHPDRCSG